MSLSEASLLMRKEIQLAQEECSERYSLSSFLLERIAHRLLANSL
jgi:hypothetical protein